MKKQTIAVDVDDVLAVSAKGWVGFSNANWGHSLTTEDYLEDWGTMWGVGPDELARRRDILHNSEIVRDFDRFEDAGAVLRKLAKSYHMVITTARVEQNRAATQEWLAQHFDGIFEAVHLAGFFDKGHLNALSLTKQDLLKSIGADYMIDDQPKHCFAAAEAGIQAILFGDYGWNRDVGPLPTGVTRCKDWTAIGEYFDGIS